MPKLLQGKPLNANAIDAVKPGATRKELRDAGSRGLSFIVQPTGHRSWALRFRHEGERRKVTLGTYPQMSLAAARERASEVRADPDKALQVRAPASASEADTVAAVWKRFLELHLDDRRLVRESSSKRLKPIFEANVLPRWKKRLIADIRKSDVIAALDEAQKRGISARNSMRTILSLFFNWAVGRAIIENAPTAGIPKLDEKSRERTLAYPELKTIWQGCNSLAYPFGPMFQLLLLTGARRDEIASLEWSEVDLDARYITIPRERTKTDSEHAIYLTDAALEILKPLPRLKDCKFVFSTTGDSPSSGFSKAKALLDKIAPCKAWRLHDLRRTFSTGLVPLGVNEIVIEKALNHTLKGPLAVYNRHPYTTEKKAAWEIWTTHVGRIVTGEVASNVIPLQPSRTPEAIG
ncbi:MAG: tyrosine-type recombinase/integrase [Pseudolabrys sp.]|nr:tyrosine-type recombinase/integrase [Pseudolabrys sp.]